MMLSVRGQVWKSEESIFTLSKSPYSRALFLKIWQNIHDHDFVLCRPNKLYMKPNLSMNKIFMPTIVKPLLQQMDIHVSKHKRNTASEANRKQMIQTFAVFRICVSVFLVDVCTFMTTTCTCNFTFPV